MQKQSCTVTYYTHVQRCSYTPSPLTTSHLIHSPTLLISLYHHPLTSSLLPSSTPLLISLYHHPLTSSPLLSSSPPLTPSQDAPFNPSMFGTTLEDVMELQSAKFPDHTLPWVIEALTDAVLKLNGPQTEGIFRYHSTVLHTTRVKSPIPESLNCRLDNYSWTHDYAWSKMLACIPYNRKFSHEKTFAKIGESKIFVNCLLVPHFRENLEICKSFLPQKFPTIHAVLITP